MDENIKVERRKSARCTIRQMIGYFPGREEYLWAEGVDLSRDGLRCSSKESVDPLTNLFLMLELEREGEEGFTTIRCEGFVKHSQMEDGRCVFGVKIEHMSEEDWKVYEAHFAQLEARQACPNQEGPEAGQA